MKIFSHKAIYEKYIVFANGDQIGQFTLGPNAWVLFRPILTRETSY
jgi:hypothetical protein